MEDYIEELTAVEESLAELYEDVEEWGDDFSEL